MQNMPLAHELFETGKVNQYIPVDLMSDIAEVLRWVMDMEREKEEDDKL